MDVLVARCPAVVVPFAGAAESEQAFRAAEFSRRGLITVIDEAALTPAALAAAVRPLLTRVHGDRSTARPPLNLDGAATAARHIRSLVSHANRTRMGHDA
jgi:predicted glycosyltransferase